MCQHAESDQLSCLLNFVACVCTVLVILIVIYRWRGPGAVMVWEIPNSFHSVFHVLRFYIANVFSCQILVQYLNKRVKHFCCDLFFIVFIPVQYCLSFVRLSYFRLLSWHVLIKYIRMNILLVFILKPSGHMLKFLTIQFLVRFV